MNQDAENSISLGENQELRAEFWFAKAVIPTGKWPRRNLYKMEITWSPAEGLRDAGTLRNALASPTTPPLPFWRTSVLGENCIRKMYNRGKNVSNKELLFADFHRSVSLIWEKGKCPFQLNSLGLLRTSRWRHVRLLFCLIDPTLAETLQDTGMQTHSLESVLGHYDLHT